MKTEDHFFEFQSESVKIALLIIFILAIAAVLFPVPLIRLILMAFAAGPAWWAAIQLLRRNRGVKITETGIVIQRAFSGKTVPFSTVQSAQCVFGSHLAVAYSEPRVESVTTTNGNIALMDARPRDAGPKRRLIVSGPVRDIALLEELVNIHLKHLDIRDPLPDGFVALWAKRRRTRNRILVILGLMATPLYAIVLFRLFGAFFR
jgi:hypothetical protein